MGFDQPKDLGKGRDGRRSGPADLDQLHGQGAQGCAGIVPSVPEGMVSKEVVGAKGPAKEYFYKHAPEEVPEQQAGDADSKPVDWASGTGSPACSEASRANLTSRSSPSRVSHHALPS